MLLLRLSSLITGAEVDVDGSDLCSPGDLFLSGSRGGVLKVTLLRLLTVVL